MVVGSLGCPTVLSPPRQVGLFGLGQVTEMAVGCPIASQQMLVRLVDKSYEYEHSLQSTIEYSITHNNYKINVLVISNMFIVTNK